MTTILALDTSSAVSSAAAVVDGELHGLAWHADPRGHLEALAGLIARVRGASEQVDVVVCGVGPGPYSGLRVGCVTAQMLGCAWQVPVLGVCSLDAIAAGVVGRGLAAGPFFVAQDARRREEYWAHYDDRGERTAGPSIQGVGQRADGLWFGSVAPRQPESAPLRSRQSAGPHAAGPQFPATHFPSAADIGRLAWNSLETAGATPVEIAREIDREPAPILARHGTDDGGTAHALAGRVLLPPRPLYLRRPDVHQGSR